ncbi:MAG: exopolyphosphatase [Gammaproteobacteria bacterium]|uniref:exopolyphosphatase n=1 Tax=Pseudomaricurvus alcaniphilus TaxID=1166482 RepID=UPI0014092138|nr:exopolyphosphatase [Pseudomaricurvus alcaniphilus]MBR9909590.1 exopolyphosphatase [Gammaproteobacteria bacterium]NHN36994.1 exopolyphosphatase [Pseudomaricurvus alcaniphilus]
MTTEQAPPVFAALDLGSNSFHLLIARCVGGRVEVVDRHKEMVRLASGLQDDGTIAPKAVERALESLSRFAERIRSTPNAQVHIVGTNTLRAAVNSDDFLTQAEAILGTPINIISGIEEARLIYRGVVHDLAPTEDLRLVVDIGGGSTELIVGDVKPLRLESLYMGCVSYSKEFFPDGQISSKLYKKARMAAQNETESVAVDFSAGRWQEAVGTSGTIRAILGILEAMGLSPNNTITRDGLEKLAEKLCDFDHIDKVQLPGLSEDRRPVLPGGLAVLHGVFNELKIDEMQVSSYAIREGMILDLAGLLENHDIRNETVARMMQQYRVDSDQASRVTQLACRLLSQVRPDFGDDYLKARRLMCWATDLHEVGLSVSHASHNKHSAYLLQNSDMPGFSRQDQKLLSFIVLNHRRKLRPMSKTYGFNPDWRLVQIIRLACLFARRRTDDAIPTELAIAFTDKGLTVKLAEAWLDQHPLTAESLQAEQKFQRDQDLKLDIVCA